MVNVVADEASFVDRAYRLGYVCAYRLLRVYWHLRRPTTNGALIAIWAEGEVLLVRNSYVPYYSAPGGYMHPSEDPREAARRELAEEVGIDVAVDALELALDLTHPWEGKLDHVRIFQLTLARKPKVAIDRREVIEARWCSNDEALTLNVFPPLKQVIARRRAMTQ